MYNMIVQGTVNKKLIAYIERVYNYLGLAEFEDCLIDLDFVKECAGGAGGYCDGDDEMINVEIARQDAVGRIPMKNLMINIAHELVHVQQMASGRLVNKGFVFRDDNPDVLTTKQIFEGKEYIGVRYDEQPWEIEAYKLEEVVYEVCK
jgi:hypothetical protein